MIIKFDDSLLNLVELFFYFNGEFKKKHCTFFCSTDTEWQYMPSKILGNFLSHGLSCHFIGIYSGFDHFLSKLVLLPYWCYIHTGIIYPRLKRTKVSGLLTPSLTYSSLTKPDYRNYIDVAYSCPRDWLAPLGQLYPNWIPFSDKSIRKS